MTSEFPQSVANLSTASAAQKSAIDALQKFYSLIVAAAFTAGVLKFIQGFSISNWDIAQTNETFLFIAFVSTVIPFYHGMERHLFETHIARNDIDWGHKGKPSPLLMDIMAFMAMGALFVAMGRNIDSTFIFISIWSSLLVFDILWSVTVWAFQKGTKPIWAKNNGIWLLVAWIAFFAAPFAFEHFKWNVSLEPVFQTGLVALCELLRSVFDYKKHWRFYFPDETGDTSSLIYLAAPYSNDAPNRPDKKANAAKRNARFNAVTDVARQLIEEEKLLYSPLTMTHPIDLLMANDPGSDYWVAFDEAFMKHCDEIYVLQLPGWEASSGVRREIASFASRGIKPTYILPKSYGITDEDERFKAALD